MKAAGMDMKEVVVGGVDATQDALQAMQAGDLDVTVFQDAAGQGKGSLDAALKLAKGEAVDQKVYIPFQLVTPANIDRLHGQELTVRASDRAGARRPGPRARPRRAQRRRKPENGADNSWHRRADLRCGEAARGRPSSTSSSA